MYNFIHSRASIHHLQFINFTRLIYDQIKISIYEEIYISDFE